MFSCKFYEISKNTFFYRTPPVAAFLMNFSELWLIELLGFSTTLVLLGQTWYISEAVLRTVLNIYDGAFYENC